MLVGGVGKCLSWPYNLRNLDRISIRYYGDAYSLPIRKSGSFIGGLGGQIILTLKRLV